MVIDKRFYMTTKEAKIKEKLVEPMIQVVI